jgi:hypothetical protein
MMSKILPIIIVARRTRLVNTFRVIITNRYSPGMQWEVAHTECHGPPHGHHLGSSLGGAVG